MSSQKLSLASAILVNVNIMLGSGIFINTVLLAENTGSLGAATYAMVGIIILPLILSISKLFQLTTDGGTFYHFGNIVSPFLGFISSFSYFIAKLASSALGIHVCVSLVQQIIPTFARFDTLTIDCCVIIFFTLLNTLHLKLGRSIQLTFMGLKLIPLFFAIFVGLYLFSGTNFTLESLKYAGIPFTIPLVTFAFCGFEASCSLSNSIENSEKNGPRAILISYLLVLVLVCLYQLSFFAALGTQLGALASYLHAFPTLLQKLSGPNAALPLQALLHLGIAASALGASYGILYSNSWNLFTLATHKHLPGGQFFTALNRFNMPFMCVLTEGILCLLYIFLTRGSQVPLQQVGALGSIIAYTCSIIALIFYTYKTDKNVSSLSLLGLTSCLVLVGSFIWGIYAKGISSLLITFLILLTIGIALFLRQRSTNLERH